MSGSAEQDRRKSQRVDAILNLNLHLDLGANADPSDLETINVSSTGLYFRSRHYIEPMTKLALSFDVPVDPEDVRVLAPVSCEGIVARVVPEIPTRGDDGYEVAVFFTTIDAESLHHLERYIETRLTV
jgi:hypothetical protein